MTANQLSTYQLIGDSAYLLPILDY